ncbi:MAG: hypothetical protein LBL67_03895 [Coriobacteriales bacterium]|jgi:hypothetical protein|nr:hypothetical protein [Coriobacteriales bacterium]
MAFDNNLIKLANYLDHADEAVKAGQDSLAVHLYLAAFDLAEQAQPVPSKRVIDGLHTAWLLACKHSDRSTAETIFDDLEPFSSPEEIEKQVSDLRKMAIDQLKEQGVDTDQLDELTEALKEELPDEVWERLCDLGLNDTDHDDNAHTEETDAEGPILRGQITRQDGTRIQAYEVKLPLPSKTKPKHKRHQESRHHRFNYLDLQGFDQPLAEMQRFGFAHAGSQRFADFLKQTESYHGANGPVLTKPFFFRGNCRDDLNSFAWATCGEIDWPTFQIGAELDEQGLGTIKEWGPTVKTPFGVFPSNQIPSPALLVLQNVDLMQRLFDGDLSMPDDDPQEGLSPFGSKKTVDPEDLDAMRDDILLRIKMLKSQSDLFIIATATDASAVGELLTDAIGDYQLIEVADPDLACRRFLLHSFAEHHPAFKQVDIAKLAFMTRGIGRRDLLKACQSASDEAYQNSLSSKHYQMLNLEDILVHCLEYIRSDSATYRQNERYLERRLADSLDHLI